MVPLERQASIAARLVFCIPNSEAEFFSVLCYTFVNRSNGTVTWTTRVSSAQFYCFFFCGPPPVSAKYHQITPPSTGTFVDVQDECPIPEVLVRLAAEKIERVYPDREFAHATVNRRGRHFFAHYSQRKPNLPRLFTSWHSIHSIKRNAYERKCLPVKGKYIFGHYCVETDTPPTRPAFLVKKNVTGLVVNLKMHDTSADFFRAAAPIEHAVKTGPTGDFPFY